MGKKERKKEEKGKKNKTRTISIGSINPKLFYEQSALLSCSYMSPFPEYLPHC